MATVAEVLTAIAAANQRLEEAAVALTSARHIAEDGRALTIGVQGTGIVSDLGVRPASAAVELIEQAVAQLLLAIEMNDHYRSML